MTQQPPIITKDPRFLAGRTLVQTGRSAEGAIDIFATLLEESINKYGPESLEAASCYYEYGNALFRAINTTQEEQDPKLAAANAAEERANNGMEKNNDNNKKPATKNDDEYIVDQGINDETDQQQQEQLSLDDEDDDLHLAYEMMENAWSTMDQYIEANATNPWISEQQPRILIGIADVLLALQRHGDAVDAYTRALPYREADLKAFDTNDLSLAHLKASRQVVEANVLIADSLLCCVEDQDVVTTETKTVLVKAIEREFYAQGYYDKARDCLQETVFLMGKIAAKGINLESEKEDICFISTLLMGVGEKLAELEERRHEDPGKPPSKKQKT